MRAPSLGKLGADLRDTTTIADRDVERHCPLPGIPHHQTVLRLDSGRAAATLCSLCGQAVTRDQWLATFEGC